MYQASSWPPILCQICFPAPFWHKLNHVPDLTPKMNARLNLDPICQRALPLLEKKLEESALCYRFLVTHRFTATCAQIESRYFRGGLGYYIAPMLTILITDVNKKMVQMTAQKVGSNRRRHVTFENFKGSIVRSDKKFGYTWKEKHSLDAVPMGCW